MLFSELFASMAISFPPLPFHRVIRIPLKYIGWNKNVSFLKSNVQYKGDRKSGWILQLPLIGNYIPLFIFLLFISFCPLAFSVGDRVTFLVR
jgi:hypothetical protein